MGSFNEKSGDVKNIVTQSLFSMRTQNSQNTDDYVCFFCLMGDYYFMYHIL